MNVQNDITNESEEEMILMWRLQQQQRLLALPSSLVHQELYPRQQQNFESAHLRNLNASASRSLTAALNTDLLYHALALTSTHPPLGSSMTLADSLLCNLPQSLSNLQQEHQHQRQQRLAMQMISRSALQLRQPRLEGFSSPPTVPGPHALTSLTTTTTMVHRGMITSGEKGSRDPVHTFASRLHEILSKPEYSACISWLPHGRAWKILDKAEFETNVIPNHFRHARYSSFKRQVSFSCSMQNGY